MWVYTYVHCFYFHNFSSEGPFNKSEVFDQTDVYTNAWQNIWEWGVAERAYKLANAGYKVCLKSIIEHKKSKLQIYNGPGNIRNKPGIRFIQSEDRKLNQLS